jgi:hypothetical protein
MVGMAGLRIPAGSAISERLVLAEPAGEVGSMGSTGFSVRPATELVSESRSSKGDPCWLVGDEPGVDSLASVLVS